MGYHIKKNEMNIRTIPARKYGLRLPNLVLVLSEIYPIIGSVIASQALLAKKATPARAGEISSTSVKKCK